MYGGYFTINSISLSSINIHIRENLFGLPVKNLPAKFGERLGAAENYVRVISRHPCRQRRYKGMWRHLGAVPMIVYCLPVCTALNDYISLCSGFFNALKLPDESGTVLAKVPAQLPNRHLAFNQADIFKAECITIWKHKLRCIIPTL